MTGRLDGKVALVTGSTRNIGAAIARAFGAEGAAVVVTGRDSSRGSKVVEEITSSGGTAIFVPADVTQEADVACLVETTVERFDVLTTLVNNAALTGPTLGDRPLMDLDRATLDRALLVNLTAVVTITQRALPHLIASGNASIVNISSLAAQAGAGHAAYAASKGAIDTLTRSMALAHAKQGVRVNAVAPGVIEGSDDTASLLADPDFRRRATDPIPLPYLGRPEDVAAACVFLASDEARFITKLVLPVNGGIFP